MASKSKSSIPEHRQSDPTLRKRGTYRIGVRCNFVNTLQNLGARSLRRSLNLPVIWQANLFALKVVSGLPH
jgi:hypothetical protein